MNLSHLWAFIWLRWRLGVNRAKRAGTLSAAITALVCIVGLIASIVLFVLGMSLGAMGMPRMAADIQLFIWAGLTAVFLFFWLLELLAALQRSEALSLDKFLYLPVSPAGAFLINYLSSFTSIPLILFVPGMLGLLIGEVYAFGPLVLLGFPLLAAFIFASTALTYQFQGWLASLISNPRRRRTVIVALTGLFILLVQIPNILNLLHPWDKSQAKEKQEVDSRQQALQQKLQRGKLTPHQFRQESERIEREKRQEREMEAEQQRERIGAIVRLICGILPPGWLALGEVDLLEGHLLAAMIGTLGLGLIGMLSLMRAYRTTLRIYSQDGSSAVVASTPELHSPGDNRRARMLEWTLPFTSEPAAAVAVAGLRSLLRAPEAKMMLLTPIMMLVLVGGGFGTSMRRIPSAAPFVVLGTLGTILVSMVQFFGNIFGFDRDGFRAFVLGPIPRREILLGKNLALAPIVLIIGLIIDTAMALVAHLRWDQLLASYFQFITMYLCFCALGNLSSIFAPFIVPAGSLKRARPGFVPVITQMGVMMLAPLLVGIPSALPAIVELLLDKTLPVSLILSIIIMAVCLWCYPRVLSWQGQLLARRERQILDAVTRRAE